jgi:hypothetical protein
MKTKPGASTRNPVQVSVSPASRRMAIMLPLAVVLMSIIFAAIVRGRLLRIPLERDEGEYAYAGQLLLHGIPPYREAFNMKFPGVYAAYAMLMSVFGQSIAGIHLGLLLCNAATIVLVFLLGRRLFGSAAGAAASAAYALLSLGTGVYGTQAHATHFVVLPALAASLLLLYAMDTGGFSALACSGLLFGVAVLMKQHGALLAAAGVMYLIWEQPKSALRNVAIFCAGASIPLALTAVALWIAGVFGRFWFWTFTYAREYVLETSLSTGINYFSASFSHVVGPNLLIWILAASGMLLVWWKKENRAAARFATTLLVFSFLAVCPGLYFREHYFVLMLPAIALLAGAGFAWLQGSLGNALAIGLYAAVLFLPVHQQSDFFFHLSPLEACRRMYLIEPFPEAVQVAEYVRAHTPDGARIAVMGSEPEIYFYANRRGVSGHIYMYGMMEPQPYALTMQNEMIHDIESARPEYIVLSTVVGTWLIRPESSHRIFEWWEGYSTQHYRKVGVAEIAAGESLYQWGSLENYQPRADVVLVVYQRRD